MTDDESRARFVRGPGPGDIIARRDGDGDSVAPAPPDPLRLCIFATIAALGWLLGPAALTVFAVIAFVAYWSAWRAGLKRSRCWLRDTRLVLLYLGLLAAAGIAGAVFWIAGVLG